MTFRGVRRLDAALSNAPLTSYDAADNLSGSRTKSANEISRGDAEVRRKFTGGEPERLAPLNVDMEVGKE